MPDMPRVTYHFPFLTGRCNKFQSLAPETKDLITKDLVFQLCFLLVFVDSPENKVPTRQSLG
jgi:hypothetical protein